MDELNEINASVELSEAARDRLWQHGLHEERLFHDRLNYFSVVELGLLSAVAILFNKEGAFGLIAPITVAGLVFTVFWLLLQYKHWRYCLFLNERMRRLIPEFCETGNEFFDNEDGRTRPWTAFTFSKPLSLAPPVLFALTWVAFLAWIAFSSLSR